MSSPKPTDADREGEVISPHYRAVARAAGSQHWDRMWAAYREAWFVGNITKYVERYRSKNGLEDLKKARNYLNKLIELEEADARAKLALPPVSDALLALRDRGSGGAGGNGGSVTACGEGV